MTEEDPTNESISSKISLERAPLDELNGRKHETEVQSRSTSSSSTFDKKKIVVGHDENYLLSCDLLCCLFMSSLNNYRCDTVLRPFPHRYYCQNNDSSGENIKDFQKLKRIANELPPMSHSIDNQINRNEDVSWLLDWILDTKNVSLKNVCEAKFDEIKKETGQVVDTPNPSYVFEVFRNDAVDAKFESERQRRKVIYAYHGSRLENFHSILHNGLRNHMNKNSLFGQGTYLSSELSVCLPYSPMGSGWSKSVFGEKIGCVAVCELICHPDVKCHTRSGKNDPSTSRSRPEEYAGENIPEKYYIVQNDELVRVKYILVYTETKRVILRRNLTFTPIRRNWILRNKFLLLMVGYLLVLLAIGLGNSPAIRSAYKKINF